MAAIYQRARPARFDEVVGQDHVTSLLVAAVKRGAIGHAYLFSGPRGVGKTSCARLLAMAVNCEAALEERPCGACPSCLEVRSGSHPDVMELDAASNNSVDDVRELREQVRLAPLRGGRRVWVLDEAHMLSRAAANALLKTLEEPPAGLLFVLATTEPEKLPPTVLSRCQHFRFRRLGDTEIRGKLERLLVAEELEAEPSALDLLARSADGAMRDAESMLERLIASGEQLTLGATEAALGLPPKERLTRLASALVAGDLDALLRGAAELYADGFAPRTLAEQVARTLRDALVEQVRGIAPDALVGSRVDEMALVRALDALDEAQERFVRRGDLYALEVTLIRASAAMLDRGVEALARTQEREAEAHAQVAHAEALPQVAHPEAPPQVARAAAPAEVTAEAPQSPFEPNARPARPSEMRGQGSPPSPATSARPSAKKPSWHALLSRAGPQLKAFLLPAEASIDEDHLEVHYDSRHAFHFSQLQRRESEFYDLLEEAGAGHLSVRVRGPGGRLERGSAGRAATGVSTDAAATGTGPITDSAAPAGASEPKKA